MDKQNKAIATYTRTKEIMDQFQIFTKKNFGQNFIIDPTTVERIAQYADSNTETAVIEIGPGIGALTEQLAKRSGKVLCFELDDRLEPVLQESLKDYQNIEVIFSDFLKVDLTHYVEQLKKDYQKVVVCANLPYYVTTPILFHIFDSNADIPVITVMMQKEVGDRLAAYHNTKDYNALSVIVQYKYEVKIVMKVSKNVFVPKPKVDSVVLQFQRREICNPVSDEKAFFSFVKTAFTQRRKTIYNNLKSLSEKIEEILEEAEIRPERRAESLSLEEFIRLFEVYYEKESICEN